MDIMRPQMHNGLYGIEKICGWFFLLPYKIRHYKNIKNIEVENCRLSILIWWADSERTKD
jgi:hypothetical protein